MKSALLLTFLLVGCVGGLIPPPAPAVHWFSLDRTRSVETVNESSSAVSVHLDSVREAAHLSDRLVRRISDVEFIVHGDTHWVEAPSRVLERGLRRVLFEERGMVADPLGDSVTLSCELVSLEEDRRNAPVARVVLHLELSRNHRLIRAKTLIREVAITSPKIEATAHAMGVALEQAIAGAADWVSL